MKQAAGKPQSAAILAGLLNVRRAAIWCAIVLAVLGCDGSATKTPPQPLMTPYALVLNEPGVSREFLISLASDARGLVTGDWRYPKGTANDNGDIRGQRNGNQYYIELVPKGGGSDIGLAVEVDIAKGSGRWGTLSFAGRRWNGDAQMMKR